MFRMPAVLLTVSLGMVLIAPEAKAQAEACSPFSHAEWKTALDAVDTAIRDFDVPGAQRALVNAQKRIRCLDVPADPSYLAKFSRQMALIAFFSQDEFTAIRWGMLSKFADPDLEWPVDLPETHPFREMLDWADDPMLSGPEGAALATPKKGAVVMNGHRITTAQARAEVPNLVQVFDKNCALLVAFWQDGAAFPGPLLAPEGGKEAAEPKCWAEVAAVGDSSIGGGALFGEVEVAEVAEAPDEPVEEPIEEPVAVVEEPIVEEPVVEEPVIAVVEEPVVEEPVVAVVEEPVVEEPVVEEPVVEEPVVAVVEEPVVEEPVVEVPIVKDQNGIGTQDPKSNFPIVNVSVGAGLGVVAGVLYGVAAMTASGMGDADSTTALTSTRSRANWLVVGAGFTGAAAIGVGVTSFIAADGGGGGLGFRF